MDNRDIFTAAVKDAITETFASILSLKTTFDGPELLGRMQSESGVIASIGLVGSFEGSVVLAFLDTVACRLVSKMLGSELKGISQDVLDGAGEIANIIAGGIKRRLENTEYKFDISIPTVVYGKEPLKVAKLNKVETIELNVNCQEFAFMCFFSLMVRTEGRVSKKDSGIAKKEDTSAALKNLIDGGEAK